MTPLDPTDAAGSVNFFISYTGTDRSWAAWVAWELERAGFTYRMQAEHFPPGSRFVNEMRQWTDIAGETLPGTGYFNRDRHCRGQDTSIELGVTLQCSTGSLRTS